MKFWTEVRRAVLVDGLSKRQACRKYKINFRTLQKILSHEEPPPYQQPQVRPKPQLGPFLAIIHEILQADKKQPIKQRHTSKKIFERLRDEHGYTGGKTVVQDEVRRWRRRKTEVFMPLSHPPGWAQFDFGEAKAVYRGRDIKVMFCVMVLPHIDAFSARFFHANAPKHLITQLMEAREERQLMRMKAQLAKLDLLILDELGYVPASKLGSELLFDVISMAYERTSVIVTTNLPFEQWTEVLGSERLTGAVLDRLTHRCHILEATGESYRLKDARRRSGSRSKPAKTAENERSGGSESLS
jgi:hypothetical protein